jgi:mRNA interferase MazF
MMKLSRLDIVLVDLNPTRGSEIQKTRPCVIVSPDIINHNSRTVIVCAITHYDERKARSFFFVPVAADQTTGLAKKSLINTQQIRTIDKVRILKKFGKLHNNLEASLDYAITLATGTDKEVKKL